MKKTLHCALSNTYTAPSLNVDAQGFAYKVEITIQDPELKSVFKA
jgi:hypothetical protein